MQTKTFAMKPFETFYQTARQYIPNMNFFTPSVESLATAELAKPNISFLLFQYINKTEREGFEPSEGYPSQIFEICTLNHSDISPFIYQQLIFSSSTGSGCITIVTFSSSRSIAFSISSQTL